MWVTCHQKVCVPISSAAKNADTMIHEEDDKFRLQAFAHCGDEKMSDLRSNSAQEHRSLACGEPGASVLLFSRFGTLITLHALAEEAIYFRRPTLELLCLITAAVTVGLGFLAILLHFSLGSSWRGKVNARENQLFAGLRGAYVGGVIAVTGVAGGRAAWASLREGNVIAHDWRAIYGFSLVGRGAILLLLDEAMCNVIPPICREVLRCLAVTMVTRMFVLAYPENPAFAVARPSFEISSALRLLGSGSDCPGDAGILLCLLSCAVENVTAWARSREFHMAKAVTFTAISRLLYKMAPYLVESEVVA